MVKQLDVKWKVRPADREAAGYDVEGTVLQMVNQLDMMLKVRPTDREAAGYDVEGTSYRW
jgi:hypothetical protein